MSSTFSQKCCWIFFLPQHPNMSGQGGGLRTGLGRAADAPEGCAAVPQEGLQSCTPAVLHPIPGSSVQTKRGISWKESGRGPQRRCRAWSTSMMKFAEGLTSLPPEVPSSTYNPVVL